MSVVHLALLPKKQRLIIWSVGIAFVLFQFFLQLSSGVIIGSIMQEMQLSALAAGLLSSAFYYVYTGMQIPVGMLFDRQSARFLLAFNALICALGCFFFAESHSLFHLILGRLVIGAGSAFAFVGLSQLLRQYFPLHQFGFLIGLSETLGFLITVVGMLSMGALLHRIGWRGFIQTAGWIGLAISYFCWRCIPKQVHTTDRPKTKTAQQLLVILATGRAWMNGLFVGLSFALITVFAAMWAIPFIQVKLGCGLQEASLIDAMLFLGAALSCPLFGNLANRFRRRRLMIISCLSTAGLFLLILYFPMQNIKLFAILMLLMGLCCGAYMLAYSIANELAPPNALSTSTGFTNTLAVLTAPLLQPWVGFLLDLGHQTGQSYTTADYQRALLIIPIGLIVSTGLAYFLPDKKPQ